MKNLPTHAEKEQAVKVYAKIFKCHTLIETGTYFGEMVLKVKDDFKKIISIELNPILADRAKQLFSNFEHITIIQGDSGIVLRDILLDIDDPCLFWLDGHYSGGCTAKGRKDTPIMEELNCIFNHQLQNYIILIDDARCFNGKNDYPTLEALKDFVSIRKSNWNFEVEDDIIRIHRKELKICQI